MATANIISVIGTGVTLLSFLLDQVPEAPEGAKISYVIANDGANGDLSDAGGDLPDIRLWDETGEFLGITADPGSCDEGTTDCETEVDTQEAPTYALFTGNNDAICIAWTGMSWAGNQKKYGFHPGNWAHGCDSTDFNSGSWYYAGTVVPGIDYDDDVFCAWVDKDGDTETTAFQVHWPEFDGDESPEENLDYYCEQRPPVEFYTDSDHSSIYYWPQDRNLKSKNPADVLSEGGPSPAEKRRRAHSNLSKRFEKDPRIIKSHSNKHQATELCNPDLHAAGQSFVSYAEEKFCFMPEKTVYEFCANIEDGACWDDEENKVVVKGNPNGRVKIPDLSHITNVTVW